MSISKKSHCLLSQTLPSSPPQALLPACFLWNCWSTQAIEVHGGRRDAADEAHTGGAGASASLTPLSPEPSEPSGSLLPPSDLTGWWWQEEELAFGIWVPQLLPTVWPWKTSLDLPKRLRFPICGIRITATTTPGPNTTIPWTPKDGGLSVSKQSLNLVHSIVQMTERALTLGQVAPWLGCEIWVNCIQDIVYNDYQQIWLSLKERKTKVEERVALLCGQQALHGYNCQKKLVKNKQTDTHMANSAFPS